MQTMDLTHYNLLKQVNFRLTFKRKGIFVDIVYGFSLCFYSRFVLNKRIYGFFFNSRRLVKREIYIFADVDQVYLLEITRSFSIAILI
jgi:hypothetical protein